MARKTLRTPFLQPYISFFFINTLFYADKRLYPQTATVEAKMKRFRASTPRPQYQSWKATSEQSAREDALAEDPRLVILWAAIPSPVITTNHAATRMR